MAESALRLTERRFFGVDISVSACFNKTNIATRDHLSFAPGPGPRPQLFKLNGAQNLNLQTIKALYMSYKHT